MIPIEFHRRQLHKLEPGKGGIRVREGGTMTRGLKRGSLVKHKKYGICYIGGWMKRRISLHSLQTGKRLSQYAKKKDLEFLSYNSWKSYCVRGVKQLQVYASPISYPTIWSAFINHPLPTPTNRSRPSRMAGKGDR